MTVNPLLGRHFSVLLDMDVLGGLQGFDVPFGVFNTEIKQNVSKQQLVDVILGETYVKPLMRLYSCLMTPPFSWAVCLALYIDAHQYLHWLLGHTGGKAHFSSSSGGEFSFKVTYRAE